MNVKLNALKGIGTGWLRLGISMIVGFLLLPFILHRLGDTAFGLYLLVLSLTGYYSILDLGIRSSITRYVARFRATGEQDKLSRFLSTALTVFCGIALLLFLVTIVGTFYVDAIFHISPDFLTRARILFFMVGTAVALGFPMGIFEGALYSLQWFATTDFISMVTYLLRAVAVILALTHGLGLLTVALATVGCNLLYYVVCMVFVFRVIPLRLSWRLADKESLKLMVSYSLPVFVMGIAEKLRLQTAAPIIGAMFSATEITFFSVASKLVDYSSRILITTGAIFTPISSHVESSGNPETLRKINEQGSRACALIAFPICAMLIILGKPIIQLWMGARYVTSYPILVILIVPFTLYLAQEASIRILLGIGRHSWLAVVTMAEGIAVVLLSVLVGRHKGIVGVAWGMGIPLAVDSLFFYPPYVCGVLKTPILQHLRKAFLPPFLLCLPLTGTLILFRRMFPVVTFGTFATQVACGGFVYGVFFLWYFLTREPLGIQVADRLTRYLASEEQPSNPGD